MANNHQGDLAHGLKIIDQCAEVIKKRKVRAGIKFQFRQLDSFIHPDFKGCKETKHINRFESTVLTTENYRILLDRVRQHDLVSICTPFDEASIDIINELNFDIIKIASCSADDWPLLHKVVQAKKPVIASTAGLSIKEIDYLVSFLQFGNIDFALMHCVALYPTQEEDLQLNMVTTLKERYQNIPIGFSTHESPDNLSAVKIAYAKGALLFERHVGLNTNQYKLNGYSSTPAQVDAWISSYLEAVNICGATYKKPPSTLEIKSLESLKRGVYALKPISKGDRLDQKNVFFAMPAQVGQLLSPRYHDGLIADRDYNVNEPLSSELTICNKKKDHLIFDIILQVRGFLNNARIFLPETSSLEISHHYGIDKIREFGCVIINCINREYCKKLIIQLPRQKHPYHMHKRKEETFQLLYGDLEIELNGERRALTLGETALVEAGVWHKFHTLDGAIFEEISTTHYNNDSYYEDRDINLLERSTRKTIINNWHDLDAFRWQVNAVPGAAENQIVNVKLAEEALNV